MKRILSLVLTLTLLFTFSSCGKEKMESTTNNDKQAEEKSNSEFSEYTGIWSEDDLSWDFGGLIVEISIQNEEMQIICSLTQSAPASRVAEFNQKIKLSSIKNNTVELAYDDDSWGNSGTLELTFNSDYILADFKNIKSDDLAQWGFYENTYKLVRKDNAYELLEYDLEDYEKKYPEEDSDYVPTYDTSKASGILASLGMTEQEFRNSCQALNPLLNDDVFIKKDTTVPFVELYELERNPNAYIGQHFVFSENATIEIKCQKCGGDGTYRNSDGVVISCDEGTNGKHRQIEDDLSKLVPYELSGRNKTTSVDGYSVIREDEYVIFDLRDDIHSPNITDDSTVIAYMIFNGVTSNNVLLFSMISCDVIYDD